jgi:hypothetical protein
MSMPGYHLLYGSSQGRATLIVQVLRRLAGKSGIDLRYFSFAVRRFDLPLHQIPDRQRPQGVTTLLDILACKSVEVEAIVLNYLIDQVWVS